MYPASGGFHKAALSPAPAVRARVRFADGVIFTTGDLVAAKKLRLTEAVNSGEELAVGQCPSAELAFTVFNEEGLLDGYGYGPCEASLGVRTAAAPGEPGQGPYAILRYGLDNPVIFRGSAKEPWLTVNGEAPTVQPPFPVHAVLIQGNRVYCVSKDGGLWGAAWVDGKTWDALAARTWGSLAADKWDGIQGYLAPLASARDWDALGGTTWEGLAEEGAVWDDFMPTLDVHPFMRAKLAQWAAQGRGAWLDGNLAYEFGETIETFEYAPLGRFQADAPARRRASQVSLLARDRMARFDVEAGPFLGALQYPTTLGALLAGLCAYVGVPLATTSFINSTRLLDGAPMEAAGLTCREVLGFVAEAACAFARMTREGELELAWFGAEPARLPMERYFSLDVAEYQVRPIDKLQVLGTEKDIGVIIGSGSNGYQILDNPYLYGGTDAQIRALAAPIYNRLAAFPAFSPITARAVCDWAIQAGDVLTLTLRGTDYRLPVYRQTIEWDGGGARVAYESTGSATRPVLSATNRRVWAQKRAVHELTVDVNGLSSRIANAEGSVTSLGATVNGLTTEVRKKVGNDEIISRINQSAEKITIQAKKIALEGIVTANSRFKILEDGSMEAVNGKFSGEITADSGEIGGFKIYSSKLTSEDSTFVLNASDKHIKAGNWTLSRDGLTYRNGDNIGGLEVSGYSRIGVGGNNGLELAGGVAGISLDSVSIGGLYYLTLSGGGLNYIARTEDSTIRSKFDVAEMDEGYISMINKLHPVEFTRRDSGKRGIGLIAEEVFAVCPGLAITETINGKQIPCAVKYEAELPKLLLFYVQRLNKRLSMLEEGAHGTTDAKTNG